MLFPVYLVAGFVNLLAKNYNFNLNTTNNSNYEMIRVKRDIHNDYTGPLAPVEHTKHIKTVPDEHIPTILDIFKNKHAAKSKRNTYQQIATNHMYTSAPYVITDRSNQEDITKNGFNDTNISNGKFETKPNFFVRTFNALADSFGYSKTTLRPQYSQNNIHSNSYSNNGYTNQNNGTIYSNHEYSYNTAPLRYNTNYNNAGNNIQGAFINNYNKQTPYNSNNDGNKISPYTNYNSYPYSAQNNGFHSVNNYNNGQTPYYNNNNNQMSHSNVNNDYSYSANNYGLQSVYYNNNNNNGNNLTPNFNNLNNNYPYYTNNNGLQAVQTPTNTLSLSDNDRNKHNGIEKTATTEKIINTGCVLCSTFVCPVNQKRVGIFCRDIDSDEGDDYED